jgi:hypothetical protein
MKLQIKNKNLKKKWYLMSHSLPLEARNDNFLGNILASTFHGAISMYIVQIKKTF